MASPSALGCVARPSVEACDAMVEHLIELTRETHEGRAAEIAGSVTEAHRANLRERCIEQGTAREVECVIAAASLDEIPTCAP